MFEKFVERASDHLAEFRKELVSVEKVVHTLNNPAQRNILVDDGDLLANLEPAQRANLLTKMRRLCENLARLSGNQTIPALHFFKNGVESSAASVAEGDVAACFKEQASFWSIFRSIVNTTILQEDEKANDQASSARPPLQPQQNRPNQEEIKLQRIMNQFHTIYSDKVKLWNSEIENHFSNLKRVNTAFFDQLFTSSIEVIHYIISEDPNLSYIHQCLRGFQNVEDQEIHIRRKEEELQLKVAATKQDLQTCIAQGHPEICDDFVDLLILKLKSSNTSHNAVLYLERYSLRDLAAIIKALTPYHDNGLLEKLWSKEATSYKGLDIFEYKDKKSAPAAGNDNWLEMIRQLQLFSADKTNPRHLRKLTSYLSFDYVKFDEYLEQPLDKLHNILRVAAA